MLLVRKHVNEMARTGAKWRVLSRTGKGTKGTIGKNEDFRTFSKSADEGEEKSNEEALWLRHERLTTSI